MFCTNCGKQIPDDSTFCPECGVGVEAEDVTVSEKASYGNTETESANSTYEQGDVPEKKNNTRIIGIVAVLAVVIVAAVAGFMILGKGKGAGPILGENLVYEFSKDAFLFTDYEDDVIYLTSDKAIRGKDEINNTVASMDGSVIAYNEKDGETWSLYYLDKDFNSVKIDEEVGDFRVSDTGENISYTIVSENDGVTEYDLYIYNIAKQETKRIMGDINGYRISENGAMAITTDTNNEGIYIGGIDMDREKISSKEACLPISVSNDGKKAFFSAEKNLYFYNGEETQKIDSDISVMTSLVTRNGEEILYTDYSKVYYYKVGMDSPVKIASGEDLYLIQVAEPVDVKSHYSRFDSFAGKVIVCCSHAYNDYYGSLYGMGEKILVRIDPKTYEGEKLASDVVAFKMSQSGNELIYHKKDKIFKITDLNGKYTDEVLYEDKDVYYMTASTDLKEIYFIDDDDTLYYFDGKEAVRISSDVTEGNASYNNADGNLYYIEDEILYSVNKKPDTKNKVFSDDIYRVFQYVNGVLVQNSDFEQCYIEETALKFH